jgi:hypothetical protein
MQTWRGFAAGERVVMLIESKGATAGDEDVAYPARTRAIIEALADFGESGERSARSRDADFGQFVIRSTIGT